LHHSLVFLGNEYIRLQSNKNKLKKSCFYPKVYVRFILILVRLALILLVNILYTAVFSRYNTAENLVLAI
jgi:hypothetical protein